MASIEGIPAILGGAPLRPAGPPDWPGENAAVSERVGRILADGSWGKYHGPHVAELTDLLVMAHGVPHVIPCASGTAAVELALRSVPVGPGDEVILAAYDFKGNFGDVLAVGATPVLVDVLPGNWNLDAAQLLAAISPRTRAVIVTHLHGGVVDMPAVVAVARAKGLTVIEDAAQMPGARIHGRMAGTWGDAGILSFGGSKLVSAGRGGAVLTARDDLAQRIRLYTQRGNEAYPLSELQAAAVIPQWQELERANARRAESVAWLSERLEQRPGLKAFRNADSDSRPGYYKLGLQYEPGAFAGLSRDQFAGAVRAEGIALDSGFRALHKTHSARRFRAVGELACATRADAGVLTLHHPVLRESEHELAQVVAAVERVRQFAGDIRRKLEDRGS
ncbi:MAG TPA: aminotransferase class V-fold PLP-dependent enzyme [Planctomycetaceae bacterium]|nr:aminotransferase class V-fold PLP-dependent enzyme [Planctomycetaceae bacterium]